MSVNIRLKHSSVQDKVPLTTDLQEGELALNINSASPAAYIKDSAGSIVKLAGAGATGNWTRTGTDLSPTTNGDSVQLKDGTGTASVDLDAGTSAAPLVRDSSGKVSIGTATPVRSLHVATAGIDPQLRLQDTSANESIWAGIELVGDSTRQAFIGKAGTVDLLINNENNHGALRFSTDSAERARFDSSGKLLVGTSTARGPFRFQVEGTDVGGSSITATRNSADASPPVISLKKSRGTTAGSYTAVVNNDRVGALAFNGADGSADIQLAGIDAFVDGTPAAGDMPGRLVFLTTPAGSAAPQPRMTIKNDGNVGINETNPLGQLTIQNPSGTSGFYIARGASTSLGDVPSCRIITDTTGPRIYGYGDGLKFHTAAVGGIDKERARIDSSGRLLVGTLSDFTNGTQTTIQTVSATGGQIALGRDASSLAAGTLVGRLRFFSNVGGTAEEAARISAEADGTYALGDKPGRLTFATTPAGSTTPVERMRISADGSATFTGQITAGSATAGERYGLFANSNQTGDSGAATLFAKNSATAASSSYLFIGRNASNVNQITMSNDGSATFTGFVSCGPLDKTSASAKGVQLSYGGVATVQREAGSTGVIFSGYQGTSEKVAINANGSATFAGTVTATVVPPSDQKFKENITPASPQLADVVALGNQLKNFDWNADAPVNDEIRAQRQLGLIAQEAEKVCPSLVKTIKRTKQGKKLTPEKVIPAVYEDRQDPQDEENWIQVEVTPEQVIPATYEELDDSYKGISHDALIMKLLGAIAELEAKVTALEGGAPAKSSDPGSKTRR